MRFFNRDNRAVLHMPVTSGVFLVMMLIALGLGAGAYRFFATSSGNAAFAVAPETEAGGVPILRRNGQQTTVPEGSALRSKLTIAAVANTEFQHSLVLPGVVEANPAHLVKIMPPLAGRITQLKVQLGERVRSGQAIAILHSSDLGTAYADYDRAKVLLALAVKNRDRQRELRLIGGAAEKDQLQAETDYVTAEAEFRRAEARLNEMGASPETKAKSRVLTISSPISGSVIELGAATGSIWNDLTAAMMTIADLSTVWVAANVPEKDTHLVTKGQSVDVIFGAYPDEVYKGQVLFISDVLDTDTRRTKVRIAFPNPGSRLKPGMFANVTVLAPKETAPVIPTASLVLKSDTSQVFVEVAPWVFEPRPVAISFQRGDQAIVQSGLKAGEQIVVKGAVLLND